MKIQPRQQLLDAWRAIARSSLHDKRWTWTGRDGRNSISDAEHLLCLLAPATEVPTFKLDLPNETADDVAQALAPMGDHVEIPRALIGVIHDYLTTYTDDDNSPTFGGGSYFSTVGGAEPLPQQLELEVVDSYAASVRLTLAVIGFAKVFRTILSRNELLQQVREVEHLANRRLTAAMIGLLRSFTVSVWDADSPESENLCAMVNQSRLSRSRTREAILLATREVRAGLRDIATSSDEVSDLENENKLFECGWSWGIIEGRPAFPTNDHAIRQAEGVAMSAPYLYFTVVALDCIRSLFSQRTRMLGLLTDEQQRLARALQLRWDLTQSFWSKIARFGPASWPLEDMPWRTSDGVQSDYLSLLVSSIVVQEISNRTTAETDALRVVSVLEELAARARITCRTLSPQDPAIALHHPGFPFMLEGSESIGGDCLRWELADFSPQLLNQTLRLAALIGDVKARERVVALGDRIWEEHLAKRRLISSHASGLWDRPTALYPDISPTRDESTTSWYYTERVIGCLVTAATLAASPPLRSPNLTAQATDMLAEADHIYDQELLRMSSDVSPAMRKALEGPRASLRRAHDVLGSRPGTAAALAAQVLLELDKLNAARRDRNGAE